MPPRYVPQPPFPGHDCRHYFVDEAGDPTLFNRHGRVVIGDEGCSSHFYMGLAELDREADLAQALGELRAELMVDPTISAIPSMQPHARKTALQFHARADHSRVRERVFALLASHKFRFYAVIRSKRQLLSDLEALQRIHPTFRYNEDALYDSMVGRLMRDRLHAEDCDVLFARRGSSNRAAALARALEDSRQHFRQRWGVPHLRTPRVRAAWPHEAAGLQAVDYCLWALQRLVGRNEDDAWSRVSSHAVEVISLDHGRGRAGWEFDRLRPLTLASWAEAPGI